MHADMEGNQTRVPELARRKLLQREIDAFDLEACAREPRGRRREGERLAAELVRVDQDDLEAWRGAHCDRHGFETDAGVAHGRETGEARR